MKKILFRLFNVSMEQSKMERIYNILFMAFFFLYMLTIGVLIFWPRKINEDMPLGPNIVLLAGMILFGVAYRRAKSKRIKSEATL